MSATVSYPNPTRSSQSQKVEYLLNLRISVSENDVTLGILSSAWLLQPATERTS